MKAFHFSLDRVLHIRRAQLELEQAKFQRLTQQRQQLDQRSEEILAEAASVRRSLITQPTLNSGEIYSVPDYQRGTRQLLLKIDQQKQELQAKMQLQQRQSIEAERKVKLLEKLRSKRFDTWNSQVQTEQENFAADAYLARWTVSS